jgi:hypothetical protein
MASRIAWAFDGCAWCALEVGDKPKELSTAQVEAAVVNHIYGGMNVIAASAHDFTMIGAVNIAEDDLVGVATGLGRLGIKQEYIEEATQAG